MTPRSIETAVVGLLEEASDLALVRHAGGDAEVFIECRLCGEWDGHRGLCPLPAIQAWLNEPQAGEVRS